MNNDLNTRDIQMLDFYLRQYNETMDRINYLYDNLTVINNNISQIYFNNSRGYRPRNRNRNLYRQRTYNTPITNIPITNTPITNTSTNTTLLRNMPERYTNLISQINEMSTFLDNVPVIPTPRQISLATREVIYGDIDNPINENCPISLERFNDDDHLTQINHCGHLFSSTHLQDWFRNNVRCPLCRYDIRTGNEDVLPRSRNIPLETEVTEITDQLLRFLNTDFSTNNNQIVFDASNNIFLFETTIRIPR
jgi:hypothetical protein